MHTKRLKCSTYISKSITRTVPAFLCRILFALVIASVPSAYSQSKYEAENASLFGATLASSYTGYSGSAYADFLNPSNDYVEFTFTATSAGTYPIAFRYANGTTTNRPLEVKVNGVVVLNSLNFPATGNWTTWAFTATNNLILNAGTNTVRITTTGANGANIDYMQVASSGTQALPLCGINWANTQQHIDGFGFSSAWCGTLSAAKNEALYGTLGMSLLRIRIDPNLNWNDERNNAAAAHARGAKVLGTPWTPPAYMKDSTNIVHGSLLPEHYADYALHLRNAANSIGLDYVSVQNEPDWDPDYECCVWNGTQLRNFCYSNAPAIGRPIVMPEAVNFNNSLSDPTLNDPVACSNIAVNAGHFYGGGNSVHQNAISKGKPVWMTEHYLDGVRTNYATCLTMAKEISDALNNQFSAYFWWWVNDTTSDDLVHGNGTIFPSGYTIGQFAKFIRPNYYRIGTTSVGTSIDITAFKDGTSSNFVIVALNRGSSVVTQQFNFYGFPAGIITPWITSPTQSLAAQISFTNNGAGFTYMLQPSNIVSFVGVAPPWAPSNLTAVAAGGNRINLKWNAASGATNYIVKRSTADGGPYTFIGKVASTNYSDTGVTVGTTYCYVVSAANIAGEGPTSSQASATAQPAGPSSLIAVGLSTSDIRLSWATVAGASSYNVKRSLTSGGPYTTIATGITTTIFSNTIAPGMKYYYVVNAFSGGMETVNSPEATFLPYPWSAVDVGTIGITGNSGYLNGLFSVTGAGADIWGTADAFRFVYVTVNGDFTMTARVTAVPNVNAWAKAGIMIRESLNANAINAYIAMTPGYGVTWQYRTSTGGNSSNTNRTGFSAPYWVRLVRSGNIMSGYYSADGTTWIQLGSTTVTMSTTAYIGLAVTSHTTSSLCAATFDNVSGPGWTVSAPPNPPNLTAIPGIRQVTLNWTSTGATSYNVKRALNPGGPYTALTNLTTTTYTDIAMVNGAGYYYVVSALNPAGEGANSAEASVTADAFAPSGLTATPVSSSEVQLTWKAFPNAASYNLKRSSASGGPYESLATGLTATNYTDRVDTKYYYVVSAMVGGVETPDSPEASFKLPYPWNWQDIGAVGIAGSADFNNGTFTMSASGADIWDVTDAFTFAYMPVTGDCTIIARVTSVQNVNAWSKGGIMIRESLAANSVHALLEVTPGNGVALQYRSTTGGTSVNNNSAGYNAPYWIKLVRTGNTFTGYRSPDGITWTQQGDAVSLTMNSVAYIGLAVTSHNNSSLATATFDNVTTPNWPTPLPSVPEDLTATAGNLKVDLTWSAVTGAQSYNIKRSTTSAGPFTTIASVTATNYTDTDVIPNSTYCYAVSAVNAGGESANSAQAMVRVIAPPLINISKSDTNLVFTWPQAAIGFKLQWRTNLTVGDWQTITSPSGQLISNKWQIKLPLPQDSVAIYYRLMK